MQGTYLVGDDIKKEVAVVWKEPGAGGPEREKTKSL
jgi:hypothetical protein